MCIDADEGVRVHELHHSRFALLRRLSYKYAFGVYKYYRSGVPYR